MRTSRKPNAGLAHIEPKIKRPVIDVTVEETIEEIELDSRKTKKERYRK
jgi:hypothetical protein